MSEAWKEQRCSQAVSVCIWKVMSVITPSRAVGCASLLSVTDISGSQKLATAANKASSNLPTEYF